MGIIIYGSQYGTARQYAEELGRRTNTEVKSYKDATDINDYDTIIYIGALYAGGVKGMKEAFGKLTTHAGKRIFIATVGVADPTDLKYTESIQNNIRKQLGQELFEVAHIYHLRGGIDYSQLGLRHKVMLWMFYKMSLRIPENERPADVRAMIETYGKQVNFIDMSSLGCLIDSLRINS
ncbi:MAG: flavodoxin domain-containing protein [Bacteroidales bacterium]|nr:flavodoxin domain-containing protein [Bacteroidales bacterium]